MPCVSRGHRLRQCLFKLIIDGYLNGTVGHASRLNGVVAGETRNTQVDAGLRLLGEYVLAPQRTIGIRLGGNANSEEHFNAGERSVLYVDSFGRIEIGRRRGLPDSLSGYAPNTYGFTLAEFGVNSGRTLDPGATLATSFLPAVIQSRINAVSVNGVSSAFSGDISSKILYVSPKVSGFQLGLSYAPNVENSNADTNPYKSLLQTGLVYQYDFGQNFFRVGGSFSHASIDRGISDNFFTPTKDLNSLSLGTEINFGEVWTFGTNVSFNSKDAGNTIGSPAYGARGITASANYNDGKWVFGGYLQHARTGDNFAGRDNLFATQLGVAYRIDTKLRIYSAIYHYRLTNNGSPQSSTSSSSSGNVLLTGLRWTL